MHKITLLNDQSRNIGLDSLRGLAAIGIVLWHYSNFFEISGSFKQPFEELLPFFYKLGWVLVDFFFCLSGYIFFYYYADKIKNKEVSIKDFLILRTTRLYPLILVTLIFTAALEYILLWWQGKFYISTGNDIFAFFANLLFLQSGFFNINNSFNSPSWSVGIEFWIYLLFFGLASYLKKGLVIVTGLIAIFFMVALNNGVNFGLIIFSAEFERGLSSFFLGGVTYFLLLQIKKLASRNQNHLGWMLMALVVFGYSLLSLRCSDEHPAFIDLLVSNEFLLLTLILHPLLIISLCISPMLNKVVSIAPLRFLGSISYSIYLWHVPIQLAIFCLIFMGVAIDPASEVFFFEYFLAVILIAHLSTTFLENPLKHKFRAYFLMRTQL